MDRRHALLLILGTLVAPGLAHAAPARYRLDTRDSEVGFSVRFGPDKISGTMPVASADLSLDFDIAANSRVAVTLDAAGARASFPFATQAMRGPRVLATAEHPVITFVSRRVTAAGAGATVEGDITIRGITRPVSLDAQLFRPEGSAPTDRDRLSVFMTGVLSRAAFGATGFDDLVSDEVSLRILARVSRAA